MPTDESLREAQYRLLSWAQNEEMVDQGYTERGHDYIAVADAIATLLDEHKALRAERDEHLFARRTYAEAQQQEFEQVQRLTAENDDLRRQLAEAHEAMRSVLDRFMPADLLRQYMEMGEADKGVAVSFTMGELSKLRAALPAREEG